MDGKIFEEKIQEQKMMLDSIYNTIECGIIRYLRKGESECEVLSMNQAALTMLGYDSIQECIDDGFDGGVASHVLDKDRIKIMSLSRALKKAGDMVKFEYQAKGKEGDVHWIFACTQFLKEDENHYPIIQRTMTDITEKKLLEIQLRQEREMYQLALESSADILYEYDIAEDRMIFYVLNEEKDRTRKDVVENFWEKSKEGKIVNPEDLSIMKEMMNSGIGDNVEIRVKTKHGEHWFRISGKTVHEHYRPVRIVGTMHDVHDIKRAQQETQTDQEELEMNRLAINSLSKSYTGSFFIDIISKTYHTLQIQESLKGNLPKQGEYKEVLNYIDEQVAPEDHEKVKETLELKYLKHHLNDKNNHIEIEYRSRRQMDNQPIWNRLEVKMVSSKKNKPECIIISFLDITGEKQEELRREYDNTLLGYAISDSYDAIYEIGLEHDTLYRVLFDGKQIYREKHHSHFSERVEKNAREFVHPDSMEEYLRILNLETLRRENEEKMLDVYHEIQVKSSEGKYEWFSYLLRSMMRDNSRRVLLFIKSVDVRKRKELEHLEKEQRSKEAMKEAYEAANQANEAKSEFLSRMSHDIRTPLNAIIGMTAIAGTHLDDPERIKDCLGKISSSGKLLLSLVNEVLDMSKVETGKISLNEEEFSLSDMLENILEIIKPDLTVKSQDIKVNIERLKHEKVVGDMVRLQQVFMNLISNSIKYTPEGGKIVLHIGEKSSGVNSMGCYEFIFEDNGIGMSKEFIPKLFEPFERAEDSRVSKIQGTGLGMAITQNIIQMMNGTIKVESEINKGTRICVTVFLKLSEQDMEPVEALKDLSVLVVDDDADACGYVCAMLKDIGMKGESVLSGAEAIQKVEQSHRQNEDYYAVIVDWKMPKMDGIETTRAIRKLVGQSVPVIILSAYDWTEIETEAREAGVDGFITKPLFSSRLIYTLKKFLPGTDEHIGTENVDFNEKQFSGKRVLLVEDNELNCEIAAEIIGMTGATVETAENGQEAVDMVQSSQEGYYNLIFMDIQMPVMNGYDATRAIRKLEESRTKKIPIVAMTANAFIEDIQMSKDSGMNGHLAKPLDVEQLMEILRQWLSD